MQTDHHDVARISVPVGLSAYELDGFERELTELLSQAPAQVQLNCANIANVTSRHVGLIWQAYRRCLGVGFTLRLVEAPDALVRTLRALDLDEFFGLEGSAGARETPHSLAELEGASGVYTDRFAATESDIDAAMERFRDFLRRVRVSRMTAYELQTVVYEVVTNIRAHSDLTHADQIGITVRSSPDKLALTFSDPGSPFDPTRVTSSVDFVAAARAGQKCGFGLAMIRRLSDHMSYRREKDGTNQLTIEKLRSSV